MAKAMKTAVVRALTAGGLRVQPRTSTTPSGTRRAPRAAVTVNAATAVDPAGEIEKLTCVGAQAVARGGTAALNGSSPGEFQLSIFDMALNGVTPRGSIGAARLDVQEAQDFAADGKGKATLRAARRDGVNAVFARRRKGQIEGRVGLDLSQCGRA